MLVGGPNRRRPDRPRRLRRARRPRWLVPALVLALLAGVAGDRWAAAHEATGLRACLRAGDATVGYHDRRVLAAVDYVSPALTAFGTRPEVRASLRGLVERTARDGLPPLAHARARCHSVRVLPWHRDELRARAAVSAYLGAAGDHLAEVGRDATRLGRTDQVRAERRERALREMGRLGPVSP